MTPGRQLAKMRAQKLRDDDRRKLAELRDALVAARARKRGAMQVARQRCRRARAALAVRIAALRVVERERLKREIKELRQRARAQCQARKHRIRTSGGNAVARRRALLQEERRLQAQLSRLAQHAKTRMAKHRASARERKQESDDHVRSNLPAELHSVWEQVKRTIKGSQRVTRTEAFFEWAESHPEDVLRHQAHEADREVERLVREHYATQTRLRKGARHYRAIAVGDVPF